MLRVRRFIALVGGAAAGLLAASFLAVSATGSASAQTYPSRPITLVVPYPPGGATDAIARIIQDSMSQSLGQQIVIENIGGAGGMIAAGRAARAAPDGYTVLLHQVALAAGMTLYPNLAFDAEKDFVPIGLINTAASTLAARPTLPPNDIAELVRWTSRSRIPASARSAIWPACWSPRRSARPSRTSLIAAPARRSTTS